MRFLLLVFIVIPLVEMMLLFEVANVIGGLSTVGLVVLTAVIGIQILKRQGISTLLRAQHRLQSGELPAQEIVEGMMLAGAGALLLTPGFITDTLGFIFLTGPLRRPIAECIIRSEMVKFMGSGAGGGGFQFWSRQSNSRDSKHGNIYEGEYSEDGLSQIGPQGSKKGPEDEL
ncbi:MAG: FxsA family protein [Pseudohongiellaceae bacterium]